MKTWFISLLLLLTAPLAMAGKAVDVMHPYARAVPPGQSNSAIFMMLKNNSPLSVSLIKAQSAVAENVELHAHMVDNGVMKMRQVPEIAVPGNGSIKLQPGGYHIMLIGLKQDLNEGDKVRVRLYFSNGSMSIVELPVKKVQMGMGAKHKH